MGTTLTRDWIVSDRIDRVKRSIRVIRKLVLQLSLGKVVRGSKGLAKERAGEIFLRLRLKDVGS